MQHDEVRDVDYKIHLSTWKKIIRLVFSSKKRVTLLLVFSLFLTVLDVLIPLINRYAIDTFFVGKSYETLPYFFAIYILMGVAFGFTVWGFIHQAGAIEAEISYELRRQAFKNLQRLSFSYFDQTPQGWVMARMTSDASRLSLIISWGLVDMVWASFLMIFTLIVLFITFFKLALIMTIIVPIMLITAYFFRKIILKYHRKARKHNSQLTAQFNEGFVGAKTTKSLGIEHQSMAEFNTTASYLKKYSLRAVIFSALFSSLILLISYIAVGTTMYQGSMYVLNTVITIGTLQMFLSYAVNFFEPVMSMTQMISNLQNAQASAERIVGLIETQSDLVDTPEVEAEYGTIFNDKQENWEPLKGEIEFNNVSFFYKKEEPVLEQFNFKIQAGQSVALVGHTGSGKTTIVNLLSRFYEPKEGTILIDGKDYRNRSLHWLHKRLGYVLQSPHLFSTSIMENIRYGRLDATDEEVVFAAKMVGVDDFVQTLDEGYNTLVGEGGSLLSVGQKQLISFARAIIANPRILVLDEATSSIDSESERVIQDAIGQLLKGRTSFIVAHRLSTIVKSDIIVMLEMGKIIEMGTHQELIQKRGKYYQLYKNQFVIETLQSK